MAAIILNPIIKKLSRIFNIFHLNSLLIYLIRGEYGMNYFKRDKVKVKVFVYDADTYNAMAFDGKYGVSNCYGTTPEKAKEMAIIRLAKCYENENLPNHMKKISKYNNELDKWEWF
jgi:hypothetical protein